MTNPAFLPSWSMVADQIGGLLFSRGIQFGVQFGTAQFSTSASPLAIYTEHTARFTAPNTEALPQWEVGKPLPKGAWVIYILPSMHDIRFWDNMVQVLRDLRPNTVYALLIHPNSSNGPITLGPSLFIDSGTPCSCILCCSRPETQGARRPRGRRLALTNLE